MKVKVYKSTTRSLIPDEIEEDAWQVRISLEHGSTELRISDDHGQLKITVEGQLIAEPCAANAIKISKRNF